MNCPNLHLMHTNFFLCSPTRRQFFPICTPSHKLQPRADKIFPSSIPIPALHTIIIPVAWWRSGRVLGLWPIGRGFESRPPRCRLQPSTSCYRTRASITKRYNLVPANGRWCLATGKVTVDLASHWPHLADISGSSPMGSRPRRGRCAPAFALLVQHSQLYLYLTLIAINFPHPHSVPCWQNFPVLDPCTPHNISYTAVVWLCSVVCGHRRATNNHILISSH